MTAIDHFSSSTGAFSATQFPSVHTVLLRDRRHDGEDEASSNTVREGEDRGEKGREHNGEEGTESGSEARRDPQDADQNRGSSPSIQGNQGPSQKKVRSGS